MSQALIDAGVIDYRIFLDPETHHLFAVMHRRVDHDLNALPRAEVMKRWWAMMADVMEAGPDNVPVQVDLQPVFHLKTTD